MDWWWYIVRVVVVNWGWYIAGFVVGFFMTSLYLYLTDRRNGWKEHAEHHDFVVAQHEKEWRKFLNDPAHKDIPVKDLFK